LTFTMATSCHGALDGRHASISRSTPSDINLAMLREGIGRASSRGRCATRRATDVIEEGTKNDGSASPFIVPLSVISAVRSRVPVDRTNEKEAAVELALLSAAISDSASSANFLLGCAVRLGLLSAGHLFAHSGFYNAGADRHGVAWTGLPQLIDDHAGASGCAAFDPRW